MLFSGVCWALSAMRLLPTGSIDDALEPLRLAAKWHETSWLGGASDMHDAPHASINDGVVRSSARNSELGHEDNHLQGKERLGRPPARAHAHVQGARSPPTAAAMTPSEKKDQRPRSKQ